MIRRIPSRSARLLHIVLPLLAVLFTPALLAAQQRPTSQTAPAGTKPAATADSLTFERIFFEPYLSGVRPTPVAFSADGRSLLFSWNDSAHTKTSTYRTPLDGSLAWSKAHEKLPARPVLSPDRARVLYVEDGNLMIADARLDSEGLLQNRRALVSGPARVSNPQWSPSGGRIAWQQDGDIWVMDLAAPSAIQATRKGEKDPSISLSSWIGNDRLLLTTVDRSSNRTVYFPEYVDEFVQPGASSRGISKTTWHVIHVDSAAKGVKPTTLYTDEGWTTTDVSPSGRYVAFDIADAPMKHREIRVFDLAEDTARTVFRDSTDGWLYGRTLSFAPTTDVLMFQSEQTGWNHVYTVYPEGSGLERHTEGEYDIPFVEWLDDATLVMATTEIDLGERHIHTLDLRTGASRKLTEAEGYRYQFLLSPDRSTLVYAYTTFNQPYDLYRIDLRRPRGEVRLTNTVPEGFHAIDWQREEYVRFTGRDGETGLSMSILKPEGFNPLSDRQYPAVVFVHGAGSLQNVYKGWSNNYYREYMFHQWLTRNGYVVVEVDFRHSTGYGRKFREDVTNWMGRYETEDVIDGLDWIKANGDYIDRGNVGIYGGSYGGFMALYATTVEPDHFQAAAALRAVTNWRNYYQANPWYTLPRLGDPETSPDNYKLSSPLDRIADLRHPVLILHGLVDDNVGFQDAAQYIEALIMAGDKEFDMMMYPSEPHGFVKPESWHDEYLRIARFFDRYLKD